ncbi:sufE-like protein 1, chloroplastic/mitochondrial [Benincasa hispida]|uniref:sufE-like protein 1, chloroplastic/mitochondrial n=1 Tax=Benincasa hispida TaxID=102211 RepID=UPI0019000BE3|nr:sufE-like protein 1, chloroplastic/mitochondrial [Benincasa hispida]XP_038897656.1 sufE-like protein 1, chloroplastic/mitochondrial [Benincasa hispida]XP_038897658.1 sufE-like protein 1, chloroplastic/mitochondrial [Benincasa hispida]
MSSSRFRLLTAESPIASQIPKTLISFNSHNFPFFRSISFQRLPSKSPSSLSVSASAASSKPLQPIEQLPPKLQEIVKLFQSVQDSRAKYEQLMFYGKNLKPLDPQFKNKSNKVEGCVSQVWVRAYLDSDKNVVYEADSDSVLTKGLAALLVQGLSNRPVEEILRVSPDFVVLLGLQQSLTPSRNNGFLNMLKLMQKKALALLVESEKGNGSAVSSSQTDDSVEKVEAESNTEKSVEDSKLEDKENHSSDILGSRGKRIKEKLERELSPVELYVEDISYQHAGHAGVKGSDGETHFNLKVVSKEFEGKSLVKRHRLIYNLLQDELQSGLHALSISAKTPDEL